MAPQYSLIQHILILASDLSRRRCKFYEDRYWAPNSDKAPRSGRSGMRANFC